MSDTAFALGLFVIGNSRSLFVLTDCLEIEKIQKMVFSDFDSLLCAPTVRIFKIRTYAQPEDAGQARSFVRDQGKFLQGSVARQKI